MAAKRSRARDAGLCITCCRERPNETQVVCASCAATARNRAKRGNEAARKRREAQRAFQSHLRAGDNAYAQHLYAEAAQHYQDAIHCEPAAQGSDQRGIVEKLARALSFLGEPASAEQWFDRAFAFYAGSAEEAQRAVELLYLRAKQFVIDARTETALPLVLQAVQIAEANGDKSLLRLARARVARLLITLSRYREAEAVIARLEHDPSDSPALSAAILFHKATIAAAFGRAGEAFEDYEKAMRFAEASGSALRVINVWLSQIFCAATLGHINLAKTCAERALLLARKNRVTWLVPHLNLEYADILARSGQPALAHEHLLTALAHGIQAPNTRILLAEVGIPLALQMSDEAALDSCADSAALDYAFRSAQPNWIGPVASVFAQWHSACERPKEARTLLRRALSFLDKFEILDQVWSLPVAIARFGLLIDAPRARRFIEARAELPSAGVAKACLKLFDAYTASRTGRFAEARLHGVNAIQAFDALGWFGYANLACKLVPGAASSLPREGRARQLAEGMQNLTTRQRQVVEAVLRGLTNRQIAAELRITERTVEAHMTAILTNLGVRSRYQLVGS